MSVIMRANRWFDHQPEPWRFLIFMLAICLPIGLTAAFAPPLAYLAVVAIVGGLRLWWLKVGARR